MKKIKMKKVSLKVTKRTVNLKLGRLNLKLNRKTKKEKLIYKIKLNWTALKAAAETYKKVLKDDKIEKPKKVNKKTTKPVKGPKTPETPKTPKIGLRQKIKNNIKKRKEEKNDKIAQESKKREKMYKKYIFDSQKLKTIEYDEVFADLIKRGIAEYKP